jgi:hypothetical protein
MSQDTWKFQKSESKLKFQIKKPHKIILDSASTNFHNEISNDNSSEMLWLLSLYSAELFLPQTFSTRVKIIPKLADIQDYFQRVYWEIRKIWHDEQPANILFTGADVIFIKPIDFSKFSGFQMFNYASPSHSHKSRVGDRGSIKGGSDFFHNYFNADVRYYSHDMEESLWSIGDSWAKNWVKGIWEYEQDLWNAMLRSQESEKTQITPEFAYQAPVNVFENQKYLFDWNRLSIEDAKLVHFHSSRSPRKALELASNLIFNKTRII